ncbi:MAG TPA: beta-propeller domain-containing protein [Burkholderiales bacterium]|nr:beta-propeller domain-containing protein [Burkholderiales bacterium]
MNRILFRSAVIGALLAIASGCASAGAYAPRKTLKAFANEQEISQLFARWHEDYQRRMAERGRRDERRLAESAPQPAAPPATAAAKSAAAPAAEADSITNVQHAGVDEGGIVKLHGNHLVILRRGRLFTVDVRDRQLRPVSAVDAYGKGIEPQGAWYDEMLISGDTVVVIGYSYARGGTEIGLFDLSNSGELSYRSTYHLRSNDYYSSRNYASRLIGSKLVFYTPLYLNPWGGNPFASFPAMRRWQSGATSADFKRIAPANRVYRTFDPIDPNHGVALHTVTTCELARPEMECTSTAVMGPPGRVFYVSAANVYVWTTSVSRSMGGFAAAGSAVFRIPLDGASPSMLKTAGSPIDQFSFLESDDGHLNVLLRPPGTGGDGMWAGERNTGQLGLLRVALASFSDGTDSAPRDAYRALPTPAGGALQNRYIGSYLVYGSGAGWRRPTADARGTPAYAVRYASRSNADAIALVHGVDRIEALGTHAVLVGSDGRDLHFTSVRLGARAEVANRYTRPNASQGETRSHGFYYRPETAADGLVGLPVIGGGQGAYRQLRHTSASLLFLRNRSLDLSELGTLDARTDSNADDNCRASCVDWYGNSRPLFIKERVFALLGYEIVEGRISGTQIAELRRINYSPSWLDR